MRDEAIDAINKILYAKEEGLTAAERVEKRRKELAENKRREKSAPVSIPPILQSGSDDAEKEPETVDELMHKDFGREFVFGEGVMPSFISQPKPPETEANTKPFASYASYFDEPKTPAQVPEPVQSVSAEPEIRPAPPFIDDGLFALTEDPDERAKFEVDKKNEELQELLDDQVEKIRRSQAVMFQPSAPAGLDNRIEGGEIFKEADPTPDILVTGENAKAYAEEQIENYLRNADLDMLKEIRRRVDSELEKKEDPIPEPQMPEPASPQPPTLDAHRYFESAELPKILDSVLPEAKFEGFDTQPSTDTEETYTPAGFPFDGEEGAIPQPIAEPETLLPVSENTAVPEVISAEADFDSGEFDVLAALSAIDDAKTGNEVAETPSPITTQRDIEVLLDAPVNFPFDNEDAPIPDAAIVEDDIRAMPQCAGFAPANSAPEAPAEVHDKITPESDGGANPPSKAKNIVMSALITLGLIIVVLVVIAICLVKFAPESTGAYYVKDFIALVGNTFNGDKSSAEENSGSQDGMGQTPPSDNLNAVISRQMSYNANIASIAVDPSAAYNPAQVYQTPGISESTVISNNSLSNGVYIDESAVGAVIAFNSDWVFFMQGVNEDVFNWTTGDNIKDIVTREKGGTGTYVAFKYLGIGDIRVQGNNVFVWTKEIISLNEEPGSEMIRNKVYSLLIEGDKLRIKEMEIVK